MMLERLRASCEGHALRMGMHRFTCPSLTVLTSRRMIPEYVLQYSSNMGPMCFLAHWKVGVRPDLSNSPVHVLV
jgi:hypothetical protein